MAGKTGNESSTQFTCKVIRIGNEGSLPYVKDQFLIPLEECLESEMMQEADQGKERQKSDRPRC